MNEFTAENARYKAAMKRLSRVGKKVLAHIHDAAEQGEYLLDIQSLGLQDFDWDTCKKLQVSDITALHELGFNLRENNTIITWWREDE